LTFIEACFTLGSPFCVGNMFTGAKKQQGKDTPTMNAPTTKAEPKPGSWTIHIKIVEEMSGVMIYTRSA